MQTIDKEQTKICFLNAGIMRQPYIFLDTLDVQLGNCQLIFTITFRTK